MEIRGWKYRPGTEAVVVGSRRDGKNFRAQFQGSIVDVGNLMIDRGHSILRLDNKTRLSHWQGRKTVQL